MAILSPHPTTTPDQTTQGQRPRPLGPLRHWINQIQITKSWVAHLICRVIPSRCPFERDISLFGYTVHIPALCKLNPVYEEIVELRLRALTYLIDTCSEDVASYIR
ncbi:MAG: Mo-dependent nitrogenase C-terminal domain-containing protein [Cyanobacteria bacterium J06636_28]